MKFYKRILLSLISILIPLLSYAQAETISGIVVNDKQEPLIGVSVLIKGASTGVITDVDGMFNIKCKKNNTLIFNYLGYHEKEVIATSDKMKVTLVENAQDLEELVVIGYGVQKKSDLTGSLSSVKGDDIIKTGSVNLSQALQGKAAGVYVTSNSGAPGAGATIRVRGYGSISTDLTPLYVVMVSLLTRIKQIV